jgi:hypothetical protein
MTDNEYTREYNSRKNGVRMYRIMENAMNLELFPDQENEEVVQYMTAAWRTKSMMKGSTSKYSMQVLFVEGVHLLREAWPVKTTGQLFSEALFTVTSALLSKLDLPTDKVIQQTHIRLDED